MAQKAMVENIEEIAEDRRDDYVKEGDLFVLSVERSGDYGLGKVGPLERALERERTQNSGLQEINKANASFFEELGDQDTVRTNLKAFDDLKKTDPNKQAEKLAEARIAEVQKAAGETNSVLKKENLGLNTQIDVLMIENTAQREIESNKGNVALLLPHVKSRTKRVRGEDGSQAVVVLDEAGNPRYADAIKGTYMGIGDLVKEMRGSETFSMAFEGSGGSGSGSRAAQQGGGGHVGGPKHRGDFASLSDKVAWIRENGDGKFGELALAPKKE
jgi:hypothetical protein